MKRRVMATLGALLFLGALSCSPGPQSPATGAPIENPPESTAEPGVECRVTAHVFFDADGNGADDSAEYDLSDITLTFQPGNYSAITDRTGQAAVILPAGSYTVSVADPEGTYKYMLGSPGVFTGIESGLKVKVSRDQQLAVPLAQGPLTWLFADNVPTGIIYYFAPDDPSADPLASCEEGS